jgi:hypothetical protein
LVSEIKEKMIVTKFIIPGLFSAERDCHTSLSLGKSGMVGKIKNRKRTADSY